MQRRHCLTLSRMTALRSVRANVPARPTRSKQNVMAVVALVVTPLIGLFGEVTGLAFDETKAIGKEGK